MSEQRCVIPQLACGVGEGGAAGSKFWATMADNNKSSQNKGTIKAQYQQKRLNESTKAYDKYINAFLKVQKP